MNNELDYLRKEVARQYGGRLETSTDFDALEAVIGDKLGETVSSATLKRFWGYVSHHPRQRLSTLDLLARYAGRDSFRALCLELQDTSGFLTAQPVNSQELEVGKHLTLSWMPDRTVILRSLGGCRFEVEDAGTSKLLVGDTVETTEFLLGQPLYLSVERNGERLKPYVAGRAKGLTRVEVY